MTWQTKKLGEICDVVNGGTPKTNVLKYWNGDILWITPKDMGKMDSFFLTDTWRKISEAGLKNSSAKIIPSNSVILSTRAPIGHLAINKNAVTTNQGCKGLIPNNNLNVYFLFYFLKLSVDFLNNLGSGTTFKELSGTKLKEVEIPLPPFSEQQRIVKILDEVFKKNEKAKENTEKNLQNVRELFESYLQNVFANPGNRWEEKRLEEILLKTETINPTQNPGKEFIYIDVSGVNNKSFTIENTMLLKGINAPSRARKLIKNGDVIFATIRPTLRRIAIIPKECDGQICSTGYFVFRGKEQVNNKLLFYFLLTNSFNEKMKKLQKGASYPAVTDKEVKEQVISFPKSLLKQRTIVAKLDSLSEETKKLENIYKQKLTNLEELKKSILKKAFSGELQN